MGTSTSNTCKVARVLAIGFCAVSIALLAWVLYGKWEFACYREQTVAVWRSTRAVAVALHREHFLKDPASLHVLWWEQKPTPAAGVAVHTIGESPGIEEAPELLAERRFGLACFIRDYNYVTLGQACHLALHGEDSPRVRAVLGIAKLLYRKSTEEELLDSLADLMAGNAAAEKRFRQVWEWSSWSFLENRRYFEEEIMPRVDEWSGASGHTALDYKKE